MLRQMEMSIAYLSLHSERQFGIAMHLFCQEIRQDQIVVGMSDAREGLNIREHKHTEERTSKECRTFHRQQHHHRVLLVLSPMLKMLPAWGAFCEGM
jgi:hypothetical protein